MDEVLWFELLGPLRVLRAGTQLKLGWPQQQAVLGALLVHADKAVSRGALVDAVWGPDPPATAVNAIHGYISRLREVLEPGRVARAPGVVVVFESGSYLLKVADQRVDYRVAQTNLENARRARAGGRLAECVSALDAALALWRGTPLAGVPGPLAEAERTRLAEWRFAMVEDRAEALLDLGAGTGLVAELSGLAASQPFRERLVSLLMHSLYQSGRQSEALAVYLRTRQVMIDELGVEPGPDLRRMHDWVLHADPALTGPVGGTAVLTGHRHSDDSSDGGAGTTGCRDVAEGGIGPDQASSPAAVGMPAHPAGELAGAGPPAALTAGSGAPAGPPGVPGGLEIAAIAPPSEIPRTALGFTGRDRELALLRASLAATDEQGPVWLITGIAGVGKTALAIHFAHQVADRFPDGQLWVNLRGFDARSRPLAPSEALSRFLRSLGVRPEQIPVDADERAARFRSMLAGRRVLLILDNAATSEQVRPLLPSTPGCLTVVTSRNRLSGLIARDGCQRIVADVLSMEHATRLLAGILGPERVGEDHAAIATVARLCDRLPLALRLAAEHIAAHPDRMISQLADELAAEHNRLDLLTVHGDESACVRAALSWSYRAVPAGPARLFRLLGLHAGPAISVHGAAALAGTTAAATQPLLDLLVQMSLLETAAGDQYRFHDLIRLYAAERAAAEDQPQRCADALRRLLTWYLYTAAACDRQLAPHHRPVPLDPPPADVTPLDVTSYAQALRWCDTERASLVTAVGQASDSGLHAIAWKLTAVLWSYFSLRKHWHDWITTSQIGLSSARQLGTADGTATNAHSLGIAYCDLRRFDQAADCLGTALEISRQQGDHYTQATVLNTLGSCHWEQRQFRQAIRYFRESLRLCRHDGSTWLESVVLENLGETYRDLQMLEPAREHSQRAVALARQIGYLRGQGTSLHNLGVIHLRLGQPAQAGDNLQKALAIARETGDRRQEATTLCTLAELLLQVGHASAARGRLREAAGILDDLGDPAAAETRARIPTLDAYRS